MIDSVLRPFLEHEKRKQAVIILTVLTGLVTVWPAVDEYIAALERVKAAKVELDKRRDEVAKLPRFTELYETKKSQLDRLEKSLVSDVSAQKFRNRLVELVRRTECTMRRIKLGNPTRRAWLTEDDSIKVDPGAVRGKETPYLLVTRQVSLSISGPMPSLTNFLAEVHNLNKMIHTKNFSLQKSAQSTKSGFLDMEIWLLDFETKAET